MQCGSQLLNKVDLDLPIRAGRTVIGPLAVLRMGHEDVVQLVRSAVESRHQLDIAICNAHTILSALDDPAYAEILGRMTLLNDGVGIDMASRFLEGERFPENLNGTDLVPGILEEIGIPLRIFLLGATDRNVELAKAHIETRYPQHTVVGYRDGYFDLKESAEICDDINFTMPDILLVAMGNPRQERFIVDNRERLNVTVAIGVGALFDFLSGAVIRAPRAVQSAGLEWLFRLLQEPRRLFRRYVIGIPRFFLALLKLRLKRPGDES